MSKPLDGPSILLLALVGGGLAGDQLANIAESALWRAPVVFSPTSPKPSADAARHPVSASPLTAVSKRNLFVAQRDTPPIRSLGPRPTTAPSGVCPNVLQLVGTIVSTVPPWSSAIVMEARTARVVYEGMQVGERYAVTRVERGRLSLRDGTATFACSMWDSSSNESPPVTAATFNSESPRKIAADRWEISKTWLQSQLADPSRPLRGAHFLPTPKGIHAQSIRPGTLPHKMGLRTGDRITRINGQLLTPQTALELYAQLPHRKEWRVAVERGAEEHALTYYVRD